ADRTPSPALLDHANIPDGSSLAYAHGQLWACILEHGLQRIDPATGAVVATQPLGDVIAVTDHADQLYTLAKTGAVSRLDADGKATVVFTAAGLKSPVRLSVSQDAARYAISDAGTNQVHV